MNKINNLRIPHKNQINYKNILIKFQINNNKKLK